MVDLHGRLRAAFPPPRACRLLLQVRLSWRWHALFQDWSLGGCGCRGAQVF